MLLSLDVAEKAFDRCVTTNEGKGESWDEEVHADSRKLKVKFNYEFLEDFQDVESSDKQSSGAVKGGVNREVFEIFHTSRYLNN